MPLIPALWRQRQVDLCEFKASPVSRMSSRTVRLHRETLSLKNVNKQTSRRVLNKNIYFPAKASKREQHPFSVNVALTNIWYIAP